jgi:hypothetical protein
MTTKPTRWTDLAQAACLGKVYNMILEGRLRIGLLPGATLVHALRWRPESGSYKAAIRCARAKFRSKRSRLTLWPLGIHRRRRSLGGMQEAR